MGNNGVRNIVLLVILVVMSFFLGIQASDGAQTPIIIIAGLVGIFGLLYLGERVWMAMFYLPPLISILPQSPLGELTPLLLSALIGFYWVIMWAMGYVRITWKGCFWLDCVALLFVVIITVAYIRRPASLGTLGLDTGTLGGKIYVYTPIAMLGHIGRCIIPTDYKSMTLLVKRLFYLMLIVSAYGVCRGLIFGTSASATTSLGDDFNNSRFTLFTGLGFIVLTYLYAATPLLQLLTSPKKLATCLLATIAVLLSGWRSLFIHIGAQILTIALLKRELTILICAAAFAQGGLMYLSHEHMLEELPFGIQRSLCILPGHLNVRKDIRRTSNGSSEWRKVMWRWALDPRTKYIKNYVWGDCFGDDAAEIARSRVAMARGTLQIGDQKFFSKRGVWHAGWLVCIHRIGLVGLGVVILGHIVALIFIFITGAAYRRTPHFPYVVVLLAPLAAHIPTFYISAGTMESYAIFLFDLSLVKILYCAAKEKGLLPHFFRPQSYIPLAIQDMEENSNVRQAV